MRGTSYQDTPSIIHEAIASVRAGQSLSYSDLTAQEKRDYLFERGIRATSYDRYPDEQRPDVVLGLLQFTRSALTSIANELLSQSLTRESDELEAPKLKLFHTYGATAMVVFVPEDDASYTGIFAERAPGLARFSYAGPVSAIGVVPGLGLKFFLDGNHPSQNLIVMRKLDRQQPVWRFFSKTSHNSVFQHDFTNILPIPRWTNGVMRTVNKRFETVVQDGKGLHQSVDHLAAIHIGGAPVEAQAVKAPYRLIFHPTKAAGEASDPTIDFRDDLARNIAPGCQLYDVYGLSEDDEQRRSATGGTDLEALREGARRIGAIVTESEFVASKYGDYRLFFRHSDRFIRSGVAR